MEKREACAPTPPKFPLLCSYRMLLSVVSCFCLINLYAMRVNLSVAIVCMINQTHLEIDERQGSLTENTSQNMNNNTEMNTCVNTLSSSAQRSNGEYTWSKEIQGLILGSFFWGYVLTQIVGGLLAERWGGKHVIGWSMFANMVVSALIPLSSSISPYLVMGVRFSQGLGQGMVLPAVQSTMSKWTPTLERSKLVGFVLAGIPLGIIAGLPVSGFLCDSGFVGGWPSVFYVFGIVCFVWFILWMALAANSPSEHRFVSEAERKYIEASIEPPSKRSIPWIKMLTSRAVWALIVAYSTTEWGTTAMFTYLPTYMSEVLKFEIKQNGLLSTIPYLVFWALINIAGQVSDALRARGWKTATVRKLANGSGSLLPAIFLVICGHVSCEKAYLSVVFLTLGIGTTGFQYSGHAVNHLDIAPSFAGVLVGIANSCATISGVSAPYIIATLTPKGTQEEWQVVFYVAAVVYTFGAIFFGLTACGEVQSWAKDDMPYNSIHLTTTLPRSSLDLDVNGTRQSTHM